jgi:hypothetical protein
LRTIPILACAEKGVLRFIKQDIPQGVDLFSKPDHGCCGTGAVVYEYMGSDNYRANDGMMLTRAGLTDFIAECSLESPYILQERILNHVEIVNIATEALCTCRVITCRVGSSVSSLPFSIFKIPTGGRCTDNFHTGGIAIPIDHEKGTLGSGIVKADPTTRVYSHPETHMPLDGFRLPYWEDVLAICLKAHAAFKGYSFIGWDVAITNDGPVLVEGNLFWGVEAMQMAHRMPLGKTNFAQTYLAHVRHLKKTQVPNRRRL